MRIKRMFIIVIVLAALLVPMSVQAKRPGPAGGGGGGVESNVSCRLPESNAESLEILSNYYPGYWWDHTDLTIAVQAAPNVDAKYLKAINEAIATWTEVLEKCFDGAITLTNVTGTQPSEQKAADIVLHYVPRAGGASFEGYAICGARGCPNILVTSDLPPSVSTPSSPTRVSACPSTRSGTPTPRPCCRPARRSPEPGSPMRGRGPACVPRRSGSAGARVGTHS